MSKHFLTKREFYNIKKKDGLLQAELDKWDAIGAFIASHIRSTNDIEKLVNDAVHIGCVYDCSKEVNIIYELREWYYDRIRAEKAAKHYGLQYDAKEAFKNARRYREKALRLVLKYWQYLDNQRG
jgi:hypothetical protein